MHRQNTHHDALEFADGRVVLLAHLHSGQHATVLQLPVNHYEAEDRDEAEDRAHGAANVNVTAAAQPREPAA
jgi:hypothetical protein